MISKNKLISKAFTLIELLVVVSIIGILLAISIFGLTGARESARDARRKSDLEMIRGGLELYKADCGAYPSTASMVVGYPLIGNDAIGGSCVSSNTYISGIPADPIGTVRTYKYTRTGAGSNYILCAALENDPSMDTTGCGSCTVSCNYKITNP